MFKLLILSIIFSIVGSEIQDINELLNLLPKSGFRIECDFLSNQQKNITIICNSYPLKSQEATDDHPKLPEHCRRNSDCFSISYSICSLGQCKCRDNYIFSHGKCQGLLEEICEEDSDCGVQDSICQSGFCGCKTDFYSKNGTCHSKLHLPCNSNDQCKVPYSECVKGKCKCKGNHAEHEQVCYGLLNAKCNKSTDCATLFFDCKSGICTYGYDYTYGHLFSSKPGTTAVFGFYLNPFTPEFHDLRLGEPGYNPGPKKAGNLHWVKNFTLDRVILIRSWGPSFVNVWCRAKTSTGKFTSGKIKIPGDGLCKGQNNGTEFSTKDWDVLVDLGPVN